MPRSFRLRSSSRASGTPRPPGASRVALTSSAVSVLLVATACGGGQAASKSGQAAGAARGPVTITYWSSSAGAQQTADAFNKTHPGIQVKFSAVPGGPDGAAKLANAVKGANAPDVATMDYSALPEFASGGNLEDLSGTSGTLVAEKFPAAVQSLVKLGGRTWAVPFDVTPLELFYRKDIFERYGVAVPKTWDEYGAAAEKIHQADPSVRITNMGGGDPAVLAGLSWQAGAKWYGTQGDKWKVAIDDPASRRVAEYWNGLMASGVASKTPLWGEGEAKERSSGQVATVIGAAWTAGTFLVNYPDLKGKWGIAPLPTWNGRAATGMYGGTSYIVPKGSKQTKAAAEFIRWVTTEPEAIRARLSSLKSPSSALPANPEMRAEAAKLFDASYFEGQDPYAVAGAAAATIVPGWTWGPAQLQVNAAQGAAGPDMVKALSEGQSAAEKAIKDRGLGLAG
ncbi:sugar ABC transporter substrate-binding protein [Streptomyces cirratus]|uniref:Sugar ABC transporter substrate-binding protein n=1 Tax=Streptomyces cirratus TaxID=68187 RepID=A0ABQ3ESI3_9ACTN|nr:sugar ABC transporter substrate-binding protein [Streptomyces cirratus]GHB57760.1 sugar ABC transporter substrate-binding protein [Streptomyces cirratus]